MSKKVKVNHISNEVTVWFRASDGMVYGPPPHEIKAMLTVKEKVINNEKVKEFSLTWISAFSPVISTFETFKNMLKFEE